MPAARGRKGYESSSEAGVQTEDVDQSESSTDAKRQLAAASVTRLTVNIGPATAEALRLVAENEGVTVTEALRRLVSYGELLYRAVKIDHKDVLFREGKETQQVLIA